MSPNSFRWRSIVWWHYKVRRFGHWNRSDFFLKALTFAFDQTSVYMISQIYLSMVTNRVLSIWVQILIFVFAEFMMNVMVVHTCSVRYYTVDLLTNYSYIWLAVNCNIGHLHPMLHLSRFSYTEWGRSIELSCREWGNCNCSRMIGACLSFRGRLLQRSNAHHSPLHSEQMISSTKANPKREPQPVLNIFSLLYSCSYAEIDILALSISSLRRIG